MSSASEAPLNPLQLELLKAFSTQTVDENDFRQIRIMLSRYFATKASTEAQKIADEQKWSQEHIEALAHEHHRVAHESRKPY